MRTYRDARVTLPQGPALALLASQSRDDYQLLQAAYQLPLPHGQVPASSHTHVGDDLLTGNAGLVTDATQHGPTPRVVAAVRTKRERLQAQHSALASLQASSLEHLQPLTCQPLRLSHPHGVPVVHSLDTRVLARSFFPAADQQGITLYEPFGGLAAGLEACLRNGFTVARYLYSDTDPGARAVAHRRCQALSNVYGDLFPSSAYADAFTALPQDVRRVYAPELQAAGAHDGSQWLVIAGWECQDLSAAGTGSGLGGPRSSTFYDAVRIVALLQQLQPYRPPGYLFENTAMQVPWNHAHVRLRDFPAICAIIGEPVLLDAAQFGSHAHRLRNFWTNLADARALGTLLQAFPRPHGSVADVLEPHHRVREAASDDRPQFYPCNKKGQPLVVLPTLVARPVSWAFRPGEKGSLLNTITGQEEEPSVNERERILGYATDATAAPGLSIAKRYALTGRAIDQRCLTHLVAGTRALLDADICPRQYSLPEDTHLQPSPPTPGTLLGGEQAPPRPLACCASILGQQGAGGGGRRRCPRQPMCGARDGHARAACRPGRAQRQQLP
jgi:hypothetical protein